MDNNIVGNVAQIEHLNGNITQVDDYLSGNISQLDYLSGNLNSRGDEETVYRGYSAYEIALQQGFEGSKDEWLRALVGSQGEIGVSVSNVRLNEDFTLTVTLDDGTEFTTDPIKGDKGDKGDPGEPGINMEIHICSITEYNSQTRVPTIVNPDSSTFYLVPTEDGISPDLFTEWVYVNDAWEMFGSASVDLSGYLTDVQVNGISVVTDGVANIPKATASTLGVAKVQNTYGVQMNGDGNLQIFGASSSEAKASTHSYRPIVPSRQHESVFYGLAKAAGDTTQSSSNNAVGIYTESAKSSISEMLNNSIAVDGTTPTIIAKAGIRYVCGEVLTLNITVPSTGIIDVIFTSGSSPTVLTITPPTGMTMKWSNNFDPAILKANATYEINIMDGYLGVVGKWT